MSGIGKGCGKARPPLALGGKGNGKAPPPPALGGKGREKATPSLAFVGGPKMPSAQAVAAPSRGYAGSLDDVIGNLRRTETRVRYADGSVHIEGKDGEHVSTVKSVLDAQFETYPYELCSGTKQMLVGGIPPRLAAADNAFGLESDVPAQARWSDGSFYDAVVPINDVEAQLLESVRAVASGLRFLELTVVSKQELGDSVGSGLECYSPLSGVPPDMKIALISAACAVAEASRAMGAVVGMAVADALGAPFEFLEAVDSVNPEHKFDLETFTVLGARNKFGLKPGQWTDDSSMGFCLADSLLACGGFDGSDARARFHNWWFRGYNNAFGNEGRLGSIGLGENTRKSLDAMTPGEAPPPSYDAKTDDSGNGSLMRLAPIPVFYAENASWAARVSAASSGTTHPGSIAAAACAFHGFAIARAITRQGETETAPQFLDSVVEEFMRSDLAEARCPEIQRLLRSLEGPGEEQCWNWRAEKLEIEKSIMARGTHYNGYPCNANYFGSYCVDGLAVALWSFYHTTNFMDAITRCVNFLGDADTTAAICGQLAGAFYGYDAIDQRLRDLLEVWDNKDTACRAALLYATRKRTSA